MVIWPTLGEMNWVYNPIPKQFKAVRKWLNTEKILENNKKLQKNIYAYSAAFDTVCHKIKQFLIKSNMMAIDCFHLKYFKTRMRYKTLIKTLFIIHNFKRFTVPIEQICCFFLMKYQCPIITKFWKKLSSLKKTHPS